MKFSGLKTQTALWAGALALGGILFAGCGPDKSSDSSSTPDPMAKAVTVSDVNAPEAASGALMAGEIGAGMSDMTDDASGFAPAGATTAPKKQNVLAKAMKRIKTAIDQTSDRQVSAPSADAFYCPDGGSASISGTETSLTITLTNCKTVDEYDDFTLTEIENGTFSIAATALAGYETALTVSTDSTTQYSDGNSDTSTFKGGFTYGVNSDSSFKIADFNLEATGKSKAFNYAIEIANFNLTRNADGTDMDYNGKFGAAGTGEDGEELMGGYVTVNAVNLDYATATNSCDLPYSGTITVSDTLVITFNNDVTVGVTFGGSAIDGSPFAYDEFADCGSF